MGGNPAVLQLPLELASPYCFRAVKGRDTTTMFQGLGKMAGVRDHPKIRRRSFLKTLGFNNALALVKTTVPRTFKRSSKLSEQSRQKARERVPA
jgi:hypothetical protein